MKVFRIHPEVIEGALIGGDGQCAICLDDGRLIEPGEEHNKQHTLVPVPVYEDAFAENARRFSAWVDSLTEAEITPRLREAFHQAIQDEDENSEDGPLDVGATAELNWLEKYAPEYSQLQDNFSANVTDAIDERREQFCVELNQQAPAGVQFVFSEDEDEGEDEEEAPGARIGGP
jgi:hypothetical protein